MMYKKKIVLITAATLIASCATVATRKPEIKANTAKASASSNKKAKRLGGQTSSLTHTPTEHGNLETHLSSTLQLKSLVSQYSQAQLKDQKETYRRRAIDIVDNKLNEKQLEEVASNADYDFARPYAMFRLGEKALEEKNSSKAKKYFSGVIDQVPNSEIAQRSENAISLLDAIQVSEAKNIGAVLPLSGKNAQVGLRALRGLEMGLGLHLPRSSFKLSIMDSEGNPDSARRGVEKLVKEDHVIAVVGSLLSKTAPAVAAKSDELNVPSIALSQRAGLTEIGSTVFRNSLTSEMQVRYLARSAMNDLGMKRFAILYPNDAYGIEFSNIFWDEILARGGQITAVQAYSTKETDFRLVIQRLIGTYFGEARQEEFRFRLKELQKSDKKRSTRNANIETVLPPITDFDGIFIPDGAKSLGQIAAMLAYNDVKGVKLLGTNLWNTPGIAKRAGNFANNIVFVDSVTPKDNEESHFVSEYFSLYKEAPSLIEIQAYDSGLILRHLISQGANDRESLVKKLSGLKQFPGVLGSLSMNSDREIERPLTALTVDKGEIIPLKVQK